MERKMMLKKFLKNEKIICILITILLLFFICMCKGTSDAIKEIGLMDISSDRLLKMLNEKESMYLYVGRPTCPDCEEFKPLLEDVISNNFMVFYYNTDESREDENYEKLLVQLAIDAVPMLIEIKEGTVERTMYFTPNKSKIENFFHKSK